jgi:predicted enzyme related to lactoylglutathione lyase
MSRPVHFEIQADDPEKIAGFYHDLFGWEVATWEGPQTYWMVTTGPEDTPGINGGILHRHFPQAVINTVMIDSLEEMISRVEAAGGKLVHGPNEIQGAGTHAYCADPEGNLFGMMQPASVGEDSSSGGEEEAAE